MSLNLYEITEMCADEKQVYCVCDPSGQLDGKAVVIVEASEWDSLLDASEQPLTPDGGSAANEYKPYDSLKGRCIKL